jgi:hypothetical protein
LFDATAKILILGGIPRHVLEYTNVGPTKILELACTDCSLDDCIKGISTYSTITEKQGFFIPWFTLHLILLSVCYASPTAVSIIIKEKGLEATE